MTHVEVGAQEAAYLVLQMPLRRTSRSFLFYGCFDPGQNAPVYDVGLDIGITRKQVEDDITQWGELEDDAYREMIRGLNEQQKHFMYHVLHKL